MNYRDLIERANSGQDSTALDAIVGALFSDASTEQTKNEIEALLEAKNSGKLYYAIYLNALFKDKPYSQIIGMLCKASDLGYVTARATLGARLFDGSDMPQDYEKAAALMEDAVMHLHCDDPGVKRRLAICYLEGLGTPINESLGNRLLTEAIAAGDVHAMEYKKKTTKEEEPVPPTGGNTDGGQTERRSHIRSLRMHNVDTLLMILGAILACLGILGIVLLGSLLRDLECSNLVQVQMLYAMNDALGGTPAPADINIRYVLALYRFKLVIFGAIALAAGWGIRSGKLDDLI